jgi:hypothetical protein
MICTNCCGNITGWLNKYKVIKKVRLDEMYFKEEKINPKFDESGIYIDGQRFYEHESKRCFERCPKCGSKDTVRVQDEEITWAPI